jgi:hypothetical protein
MTPFELVQWSIAGMFSLILLGIGLGIALVLIVSALRTKPRTTVNNFSPPAHANCRCALAYRDRPEYPDDSDDA